MSRVRVALALVVALAVAGCGGDDEEPTDASPATTAAPAAPTEATAPATTAAPAPTFPLTGAPAPDAPRRDRPAVVVKIENSRFARGVQDGLVEADVVYVEKVEEGVTRLAAVYHSTDADPVAPVRSARSSDVAITGNLNGPLFAFSGANGGVLEQVRGSGVVDLGRDTRGDLYRGEGLYGVSTSTGALYGAAPSPSPVAPPALFGFGPGGASGGTASVSLAYGGKIDTQVTWRVEDGVLVRIQDGSAHVEADGTRITADNVIVQQIEYRDSGFRDTTGAVSPEAVLTGEGEAWLLTAGGLVRGRWSRPDIASVTTYAAEDGSPLALVPGRTWVELVPIGGATEA